MADFVLLPRLRKFGTTFPEATCNNLAGWVFISTCSGMAANANCAKELDPHHAPRCYQSNNVKLKSFSGAFQMTRAPTIVQQKNKILARPLPFERLWGEMAVWNWRLMLALSDHFDDLVAWQRQNMPQTGGFSA